MIRLYVILGLLITALGGAFYIKHLQSSLVSLQVVNRQLEANTLALQKKIDTDAKVRASDEARAQADIKSLQAFKDNARAQVKGLKNPDRECLDSDGTDRLRAIFAPRG